MTLEPLDALSRLAARRFASFADAANAVLDLLAGAVPGGCVLLETPNPHNVLMGACDFYNDPTHLSPLPPALIGQGVGLRTCTTYQSGRLPVP